MAREIVNVNNWVKNAKEIEEAGGYVDWRERYYTCPICGYDVYEDRWSPEDLEDYYCPECLDDEDAYYEDEYEDDEYDEDEEDEPEDDDDDDGVEDDYPQNRQGQRMDDILADMYRMARNMPGCVGFGVIVL